MPARSLLGGLDARRSCRRTPGRTAPGRPRGRLGDLAQHPGAALLAGAVAEVAAARRSAPRPARGASSCSPGGCTSRVPTSPTGTTGAPVRSATRATPVRNLYSRPSGERVPSGKMPSALPVAQHLDADVDRRARPARVSPRSTGTWPEAGEERRPWPGPRRPGRGEVLGLGEVDDLPAGGERGEELVGEGDVVGGDDHRPVARDVLERR